MKLTLAFLVISLKMSVGILGLVEALLYKKFLKPVNLPKWFMICRF